MGGGIKAYRPAIRKMLFDLAGRADTPASALPRFA
jgi:hypothetical protein